MFARKILVALALTLVTSATALATPVLKSEILVAAAVVTVGDMFDDAGLLAEEPLFRAPLPGTTGMVPLRDIAAAAARVGLTNFTSTGIASVRVMRDTTVVDEQLLTKMIATDLQAKGILTPGMSAQTMFDQPLTPINAEASDTPATLLNLRYLPANGAFTARFIVAGVQAPLDVSGTLDLMISAPHLVRTLSAGTILSADDITMKLVPLKFAETTGVATEEQLVGKQLQRQSREGMMLTPEDVVTAQLITRNEFVTIYFRKGPMTLTVKGQALGNAAAGAPVQVLNLMSNKVVTAVAASAGAVEISSGPLNVAGL
ncbi:flagellar basal body P-ring formation chaperone FlgA [Devosia sp.]|uniref:flagellar basal body P-ring formation chaperone FlgA n=1 Tax=Devosia sp. TaxID=1871048 RepID=UPI003266F4EF